MGSFVLFLVLSYLTPSVVNTVLDVGCLEDGRWEKDLGKCISSDNLSRSISSQSKITSDYSVSLKEIIKKLSVSGFMHLLLVFYY